MIGEIVRPTIHRINKRVAADVLSAKVFLQTPVNSENYDENIAKESELNSIIREFAYSFQLWFLPRIECKPIRNS